MDDIKWELKAKYPGGSKLYEFERETTMIDEKHRLMNRYLFKGMLLVAHLGRGTACVTFERWRLFYANYRYGFEMTKHFKGHNASHSARAWFRYMLKNCPEFVSMIEKEEIQDSVPRKDGEFPQ